MPDKIFKIKFNRAYGKVFQAKNKLNSEIVAIKSMSLEKQDKINLIISEIESNSTSFQKLDIFINNHWYFDF